MNPVIKNQINATPHNFRLVLKKIGASAGFILGLILMAAGIFLSIFDFVEKTNFNNSELGLIIPSFLLLGLGAHCLDLLDEEKRAKRN